MCHLVHEPLHLDLVGAHEARQLPAVLEGHHGGQVADPQHVQGGAVGVDVGVEEGGLPVLARQHLEAPGQVAAGGAAALVVKEPHEDEPGALGEVGVPGGHGRSHGGDVDGGRSRSRNLW